MNRKRIAGILVMMCLLAFLPDSLVYGNGTEVLIELSDSGIKVDGSTASTLSTSAVYTGAQIIYYEAGRDSSYGEGTAADEHTAQEAAAHTVVTITKPGTYRVTGTLSLGQLAIDLGSNAKTDPTAVVTLILDGVNITSTVAPAVIFYNVYESGVVDEATATGVVNTSKAGANVILADGSENYVQGAYVARIYQAGTTKKLHKYDGAFYSKMSMNLNGEAAGTGKLYITATNEGLDSELHLTINGGNYWITSQDDGINTNEDNVSVTTINGGYLYINAGLGTEGDGIDSNGFLTINGGTIITLANGRSGDGGIDADKDILLNGGTVIALGSRNDAVSTESEQPYMELSYASTKAAGTLIRIEDKDGNEILSFEPLKLYQSFTFTSPELKENEVYYIYSGGVQQQYTGNRSGMMGGGMPGNQGEMPAFEDTGNQPPEGFQEGQRPEGMTGPNERGMQAGFEPPAGERGQIGFEPPESGQPLQGQGPQGQGAQGAGTDGQGRGPVWGEENQQQEGVQGQGSVEFVITSQVHSFSGVSDWTDATGKTAVSFSINDGTGIESVTEGEQPVLADIVARNRSGQTVAVPEGDIQITITDIPSESYAQTMLLSQGERALKAILPAEAGTYQLTISVVSSNATYAGTSQWQFTIDAADTSKTVDTVTFTDVPQTDPLYSAVAYAYRAGWMVGTGEGQFSPKESVNRGTAATVLGRLAKITPSGTSQFKDVAAGSWYASYVGWANDQGIVTGYGNGEFGPTDGVTRQQFCVMLYRFAQATGIELETATLTYQDAAQIADWAAEAVAACYGSGLLDDIVQNQTFAPNTVLTRAELASLLSNFARLYL